MKEMSKYQQKIQIQNQKIMDVIAEEPRITFKEIATKTNMSLTTVYDRYSMIIKKYVLEGEWSPKS